MALAYPHISNFDDLDPLRLEPGIDLKFIRPGEAIPGDARLVVLPGSKTTISDLETVRAAGWDIDLKAHVRRGGFVLGLCGGYQMLGRRISDPNGTEGDGVLPRGAWLSRLRDRPGRRQNAGRSGRTLRCPGRSLQRLRNAHRQDFGAGSGKAGPAISDGREDGAVSADGRAMGCYVHGLFADDRQRASWLERLNAEPSGLDYEAAVEETLDRLAAHLERHIDCDALLELGP